MVDGNTESEQTASEEKSSADHSQKNGGAKSHTNGKPKTADSKVDFVSKLNTKPLTDDSEEQYNGMSKKKYMTFKPQSVEKLKGSPMEVVVDHGVERAIKILKRKLIKEGLFKELKSRRFYSKPSEEKKRRLKESLKKIRKEESRRQKSQLTF